MFITKLQVEENVTEGLTSCFGTTGPSASDLSPIAKEVKSKPRDHAFAVGNGKPEMICNRESPAGLLTKQGNLHPLTFGRTPPRCWPAR